MSEVKIRQLKVDDVFPMVEILGKVIANIKDAAEDTTGEALSVNVGKSLLTGIAKAREEIKGWLADLCGMTAIEFDNQTPAFLIDVIEQLISCQEFKDFFGKALKYATLLQKTKQRASGKTSTQSPPATDGETNTSAPSDTRDTGK